MNRIHPYITIIIPTHNRVSSLKRLLDKLARQTYPCALMEVVVAMDGCKDGTISMLKEYKAPFVLQYIEVPGLGPAIARNRGVSVASGKLLLFLDDDIDPCQELVESHVRAHVKEGIVVIGYLPFFVTGRADFFRQSLRGWWEQKYYNMRNPAYRYSHEDLLTGNMSLSLELFNKVGGFNETLRCREDYELGIRLMKARVEFIFSESAWGFHRDEVTCLHRSLSRKRGEGKADVQCWRLHPEVTTSLQNAYVSNSYVLENSKLVSCMVSMPWLTNRVVLLLEHFAHFAEQLRFRKHWRYINLKLHNYWYLRGLLDELGTRERLMKYLQHDPFMFIHEEEVEINLKDGIAAAEQVLDCLRPTSIIIYYGQKVLGRIRSKPNNERLQGKHLRHLLATHFAGPLMNTLAFQQLGGKCIQVEQALVYNHSSY